MTASAHVAVVGADPMVSRRVHLREAGRDPVVFGEAMENWESDMPAGMLLRSPWRASSISSPRRCSLAD
jgi:hypothetical protein